LTCAVHSIEESDVEAGDMVVVTGAGPIGLLFITLAKLKGMVVISTDLSDEKLGCAKNSGADYIINGIKVSDQVDAVRKLTKDGKGGSRCSNRGDRFS